MYCFSKKKKVTGSGYGTKSVPAKMCTWYQKMVPWYISTFRQRQCEGPVIFLFALGGSRDFFFLLGSSFCERLHYVVAFCVVTTQKISDRGRWKWGVEGRYGDRE